MIINNISELRKERNITQSDLANILNVSRQTIISLESNECKISLELAFRISNYFELPIEKIFKEKDMKNIINKKATTIDEIQELYGKNTIIIKGDLAFRCGTGNIEKKYSEHLLNFELPSYGKMKKFIVINNLVYELLPTREYKNRNDFVKHEIGNRVNIDISCIDFSATPWNEK